LLVGAFITLHVVTIAIDSYLPFSISTIIVPFTAHYRPLWVGLGIISAELLIALAITNHYRAKRISYATWRKIHYVNFVVWTAATLHGLGTGTDRSTVWLIALYGLAVVSVVMALTWRWLTSVGEPALGMMIIAGTVAGTLVLILALGPLRFNPRPWNAVAFDDQLSGQVVRSLGRTRGLVSLTGTGDGKQTVLIRADLLVSPQKNIATSFQMEFVPSGLICKGTVTNVRNQGFDATCTPPVGPKRAVTADWSGVNGDAAEFQGGTLSSTAAN
jgi:sulfoxide reductase heme-binding subunit YedZ